MADEEKEGAAAAAPPPKSKMMLVGGVVALLAAGGGGWYFMAGGEPSEEDLAAEAEAKALEEKSAFVTLEPFNVNLRSSSRLLRIEVQLEVAEKDKVTVTDQTAKLRDSVLTLASDYTYSDLEGMNGKNRLRDELRVRIADQLGAVPVRQVLFTQFVVQ
jgi:flagellar FliL protein